MSVSVRQLTYRKLDYHAEGTKTKVPRKKLEIPVNCVNNRRAMVGKLTEETRRKEGTYFTRERTARLPRKAAVS